MPWQQGDVIKVLEGDEVKEMSLGADPTQYQGAEGFVVPLVEQPDTVVKIFHHYDVEGYRRTIDEKHNKIFKMVQYYPQLQAQIPNVCWPKNLVYDTQEKFCGFTMRKAVGTPLAKCGERDARGFRIITPDLLKILRSVLETIRQTHKISRGNGLPFILIGDIQPNNFIVDPTTYRCSLIDADSFQVGNYRCDLNFPNYHSPERLINNGTFDRDVYEEYYVVSYLIWEILTGGDARPYQYQNGPTDPAEAVRAGFFALAQNPGVASPIAAAYWNLFPAAVQNLFRRNFHDTHPAKGGNRKKRPTVEDWQQCLDQWIKNFNGGVSQTTSLPTSRKPQKPSTPPKYFTPQLQTTTTSSNLGNSGCAVFVITAIVATIICLLNC